MIADFDDFCTWMYVLISDVFAPLAPRFARPGPPPACTDAELITMAIVGACCGWDQETVLLSQWQAHRDLFPIQPDRTRFNRRRRTLEQAINLVRQAVVHLLDLAQDPQCIIDSLPVPVVQFYDVPQANSDWQAAGATFGHCCSKKQAIFGYKLHLLITQSGVIPRDAQRDVSKREVKKSELFLGACALRPSIVMCGAKGTSSSVMPITTGAKARATAVAPDA